MSSPSSSDPNRVIAALARDQVNLELKTVDLCFLAGLYLKADKMALASLEDAERAEDLPGLPGQVNRHTAASLVAPHSKATLTERRLAALGDVEATYDGSVRLRPPKGMVARTPAGVVDLAAIAAVLGEVHDLARDLARQEARARRLEARGRGAPTPVDFQRDRATRHEAKDRS